MSDPLTVPHLTRPEVLAPAVARLSALATAWQDRSLVAEFEADPQRAQCFSLSAPHVFADLSKNLIDAAVQRALLDWARTAGLDAWRRALVDGAPINTSEDRQVLHTLLRTPADAPVPAALREPLAQVHATLTDMLAYAEQVRADPAITDVVHIGIGGSELGPRMAVQALQPFALARIRTHFVASVDGHELAEVLAGLQPAHTLFIIASKTFTTQETMTNARSARDWFVAGGGTDVARHFCALTTNLAAAAQFGITRTFGFWDWVGGRYSVWSAIGLPLAIAVGADGFRAFLDGAHAMDTHFVVADLPVNLPVTLGLLDVWYRSFLGMTSRNMAPYHWGLRRLPAYLQQLEMESNGKRVDRNGQLVPMPTAGVVWGEPGTNGQHAFFQMLHQGSDRIPVEFIVARQATHSLPGHHTQLLANALAQAQALMLGRHDVGVERQLPGNRPSTVLVLEALTPASLGALIALYEHRVFVSGLMWGINSFDQWGVEWGKVLAQRLVPALQGDALDGLDGSTAQLVRHLRGATGKS